MTRIIQLVFILALIVGFGACQNQSDTKRSHVQIFRFDQDLNCHLSGNNSDFHNLSESYPSFWPIYCQDVLNVGPAYADSTHKKVAELFRNEEFHQLNSDVANEFQDMSDIETVMSSAAYQFKTYFPNYYLPKFFTHVSGFNQTVVVGDNFISLSLDKYLGTDYPMYETHFYDYEKRYMKRVFMPQDFFAGWYFSVFSFEPGNGTLLDHVVYYGRLYYLYSLLFPNKPINKIFGYTQAEIDWMSTNEKILMKYLLSDEYLYSTELATINGFIGDAPVNISLLGKCPARLGCWFGYLVCASYMKNTPKKSVVDFFENRNFEQIFKESQYYGFK